MPGASSTGDIRSLFKVVPQKRSSPETGARQHLESVRSSRPSPPSSESKNAGATAISRKAPRLASVSPVDLLSNRTRSKTGSDIDGKHVASDIVDRATRTSPRRSLRKSPCKSPRKSPRKSPCKGSTLNSGFIKTALVTTPLEDDSLYDTIQVAQPLARGEKLATHKNVSFSSTLSPPPPSSQFSSFTSSQRIIRDGQEMVTNSSSDAEILDDDAEGDMHTEVDSSDDSDDELEALIANKRKLLHNERLSRPLQPEAQDVKRYGLRDASKKIKHTPAPVTSYPTPPKHNPQRSIQAILERKQRDEKIAARIRDMENQARLSDERNRAVERMLQVDDGGGGSLTVTVERTLDEEEAVGLQLKRALKNMDALDREARFHFFTAVHEDDVTRHPFPGTMRKADSWVKMLNDDEKRHQAATSGFIADVCRVKPLPAELQEWFLGEIISEERDELAHAYVQILFECAQHSATSPALDLELLGDCMMRLGARKDIVDDHCSDQEHVEMSDVPRATNVGRRSLYNFLDLLSKLNNKLTQNTLAAALFYCSLILVDDEVSRIPHLLAKAEHTIVALFGALPTDAAQDLCSNLASQLLACLDHPILISNLVSCLPSLNPSAALFKRQIAFLATTARFPSRDDLTSPASWAALRSAVNVPAFKSDENTNFAVLAARIAMLDTAIGPGFHGDFSFFAFPISPGVEHGTETPNAETEDATGTSNTAPVHAFFAKRKSRPEASQDEIEFNEGAMALAGWARALNRSIRDAGSVGLRKTECKGVIEGLVRRLEGGVATSKARRKSVLGF